MGTTMKRRERRQTESSVWNLHGHMKSVLAIAYDYDSLQRIAESFDDEVPSSAALSTAFVFPFLLLIVCTVNQRMQCCASVRADTADNGK